MLSFELSLDDILIDGKEGLLKAMLDDDEAHYEVVSCVIYLLVFLHYCSQSLLNQIVLHQLVVRLAVILIPHSLLHWVLAFLRVGNCAPLLSFLRLLRLTYLLIFPGLLFIDLILL